MRMADFFEFGGDSLADMPVPRTAIFTTPLSWFGGSLC
jgi:hypothetical protein